MNANHPFVNIAHKLGTNQSPLEGIYRRMQDKHLFMLAYGNLASNKGIVTKGTDNTDVVEGMSEERVDRIIKSLKTKSYQWKPARRVYIPKSNGGTRPLGIPSFSDKLTQEVIRIVLEAYYEPQFRGCSHGFRARRSCHTALNEISMTWTGTKWFIEGDIKGCFDNIRHDKLLEILSKNIKDQQFIGLIARMLKAGYMEEWKYNITHSGTPQGGVVSPLLANIMLHELDKWVEDELIPQHTKGERRTENQEWWSQRRMYKYNRKRYRETGKPEYQEKAEERRRKMDETSPYDANDPDYRRLRYIRYADDYLFGFIGPKEEAEIIKEKVRVKLEEIGLTQSEEKTKITNAKDERAKFLGYEIGTSRDGRKSYAKVNGRSYRRRSTQGTITLHVPKEVTRKYVKRYSKDGKPFLKFSLTNASDFEIIQNYGEVWRGVVNYYMPAHDVSVRLGRVQHTMLESCVRTLAAKYQVTRAEIFRKYYGETSTGKRGLKCQFTKNGKTYTTEFGEVQIKAGKWASSVIDRKDQYIQVYRGTELRQRLRNKNYIKPTS